MVWRRKREVGPDGGQEGTAPHTPTATAPTSGTQDFTVTLHDAPKPDTEAQREARKRLKKAEADLRRLERMQSKAVRRQLRRERAIDRSLARMRRSRERTVLWMVALVLGLHGLASAMAVLDLLWPDVGLWPPLLYEPSVHWETALAAFATAAIASVAMVMMAPSGDYQMRARSALAIYLAVAMLVTVLGVLLVAVLEPMEKMEVDWERMLWVLLVLMAVSGIPLPVLYWRGGRRFRLLLSDGYHVTMGVLTAILVSCLILTPLALLAWRAWMMEAGLAMMIVGALGLLFPSPAVVSSFVLEARPGPRETALLGAVVSALLLAGVYILVYAF